MLRCGIVLVVFSLALSGAASASASGYFTDLSGLNSYAGGTPFSVNGSGQVTGLAGPFPATDPTDDSFLYTGGAMYNISSKITTNPGTTDFGAGINDSGQVVGFGVNTGAGSNGNPFGTTLLSGGPTGTTSLIHYTASGYTTYPSAIDNSGVVGGTATKSTTGFGFLYSGGTFYNMGFPVNPAGAYSAATICGFNSTNGQAAGIANFAPSTTPPTPATHDAAVWTYAMVSGVVTSPVASDISPYFRGYTTDPDTNDVMSSFALAINSSGLVAGEIETRAEGNWGGSISSSNDTYLYNTATHAVTYLSDLGLRFPGQVTIAPGIGMSQVIDDAGQVVGEKQQPDGSWHAAIWDATHGVQDLNTVYGPSGYNILPANFTLDAATAVNDAGYIAGWGTDGDGNTQQSFLLAPFLPGDANLDGKVDINDLTIVLARYGQSGITWGTGDFNNDGKVDINDLTIVLSNYGHSLGSSAAGMAAVPEPSTLSLLAGGLIALLACAWRRSL